MGEKSSIPIRHSKTTQFYPTNKGEESDAIAYPTTIPMVILLLG